MVVFHMDFFEFPSKLPFIPAQWPACVKMKNFA